MIEGKSDRTAETYAREIKKLAMYYQKPLNTLTEDEIRKFVIYRKNECNLAPSSMKIFYCGLRGGCYNRRVICEDSRKP